MKKLITLILIVCSFTAFSQTPFTIRGELKQVYKTGSTNDTTIQKFSTDSALWLSTKPIFKFNKRVYAPWFFSAGDTVATRPWVRSLIGNETDPLWTNAQPYYVNRVELGDTARAIRDDFPTGGGGFASDGVYMDGDTVKWGKNQLAYGDSSISINYIGGNSYSISLVSSSGGKFDSYAELGAYSNSRSNASVQVYPDYISFVTNTELTEPSKILQVDTTGVFYVEMPDTTLTTPLHLMTEAQTKREIAAAQKWQNISGGISYGNEVTIGSLSGTGTRNIGADANGKLVELAATGGDVMKASVTLTSPQIYNNTWVQILPAQASGKMAFVTGIILYYNYVSVAYSAGEPSLKISYDGSTEAHDFQDSTIPAFLDGTSDKVYYWPVGSNYSVITTNGALYVRNGTPVGEPYGDGTLTVTITYVVIDI